MKRILFILFIALLCVCGIIIVLVGQALWKLPPVAALEHYQPALSSLVYSSDGKLLAQFGIEKRIFVSYEEIPLHLINAVIAIEDGQFFRHRGINWRGITRAFLHNLLNLEIKEGGSGITQQLTKTLFLTPRKTLTRKIKEALLSLEIEKRYSKEKILEIYLNQIYFGAGAYGVQSAAYTYFGKEVQELNLAQSALLAGLIRRPTTYSPYHNQERALERSRIVLKRMEECKFIDLEQRIEAEAYPLSFYNPKLKGLKSAYFIEYIRQQLEQTQGQAIYKEGLEIYTTLDWEIQEAAESAFYEGITRMRKNLKKMVNGALVALDVQTGEIKAMVGGYNFNESQFNRAVQALRQPGSAFKPFIYLALLDQGYTGDSTVIDTPVVYKLATGETWAPRNYEDKFYGEVTLEKALVRSINVATVKFLEEIGPEKVIPYARAAGIESPLFPYLSLGLGSFEVTPLELTVGFATIANKGIRTTPRSIRKVLNKEGRILEEYFPEEMKVFSALSCEKLRKILEKVVKEGTAAAMPYYGFTYPCAGKTGTTNDFTDAWFVGFTPSLVATVYVGCDDRETLGKGQEGAVAALPIWASFMKKVYASPILEKTSSETLP